MKKIIIAVMLLVGVAAFMSCENNGIESNNNKPAPITPPTITASDLNYVGIEHNEILELFYNGLYNNNISEADCKVYTRGLHHDRINNDTNLTASQKTFIIDLVDDVYDSPLDTNSSIYSNEISDSLTTEQKYYLDLLDDIFENDTSVIQFRTNVLLLESDISNSTSFNDVQLCVLYSATRVAYHSIEYWDTYCQDWYDLNPDNPICYVNSKNNKGENLQQPKKNWWESTKKCARSDVTGAIWGGAIAVGANVVVGVGQVAYGSTIAGTAAVFSLKKGLDEIVDWFCPSN